MLAEKSGSKFCCEIDTNMYIFDVTHNSSNGSQIEILK